MSKFIDRLKQVSKAVSQPMGFGARQASADKPRMQLVASLAQDDADSLAGHIRGADAAMVRVSQLGSSSDVLKKIAKAVPDVILGAWLSVAAQGKVDDVAGLEADFLVYPASDTPLAIPGDTEAGKVLAIEAMLNDGLLMAVNRLPIDAVLVDTDLGNDDILTWQHLVLCQRFSAMLNKPLLVSVPSKVIENELQALWDAGVNGVVVGVTTGQPEGRLSNLREIIDKLEVPSPHRDKKTEPMLPSYGGDMGRAVIEDEI